MEFPFDMKPKIVIDPNIKRLLIVSEGFEKRSFFWPASLENSKLFFDALISKYKYGKHSKSNELLTVVSERTKNKPFFLEYDRSSPAIFESEIQKIRYELYDEIVIDISVMSKFLIMIILYSMRMFNGKLTVVYSEPEWWNPRTEDECKKYINECEKGEFVGLSSIDIQGITRTPALSSILMQNCPVTLISFVSFNKYLLRNLLADVNPPELFLFYPSSDRFKWKEKYLSEIGISVFKEYNNGIFFDEVLKKFEASDYASVFEELAEIYKKRFYTNRIIISPTGPKWHAVSCALFKICCPDVHVEYPISMTYSYKNYTSENVIDVHSITFDKFKDDVEAIAKKYGLNG